MWLHYLPHWRVTTDANAKLGVFWTAPAIRNLGANVTSEAIGTFVLVLVATAIFSSRVTVAGRGTRSWSVSRGQPGVGDWSVARRADRLRDQPRAISGRGWRTPCCRFPASATRTGAMPRFR